MVHPTSRHLGPIIFIVLLLTATNSSGYSIADGKLDRVVQGDNYNSIFSNIFYYIIDDLGVRQNVGTHNENIYTGFDQGLALITLMKLYDVFDDRQFLNLAEKLSHFIGTNLYDLRYNLVATYYDVEKTFISNYRNAVDNILIAWGLNLLSSRIDKNDSLNVDLQKDRYEKIKNYLNLFISSDKLIYSFRVDAPTQPIVFNAFNNLITAFILSQSDVAIFSEIDPIIIKIFDFVDQNMTNEEGGVYSLFFKGYHDSIVTLRNTALYANLALNLYSKTEEKKYLTISNQSLNYIQRYFSDIGITRGYIEALENGLPKQQSKSLFSHALVLLGWLKLVNSGVKYAELEALSTWTTISNHFKVKNYPYYYSTIDRSGSPGSQIIRTSDNLMMLYALSHMPLISKVEFLSKVNYGDKAIFNVTTQLPEGFTTDININFDDKTVETLKISGEKKKQSIIFDLKPPKPKENSRDVDLLISLKTELLVNDYVISNFKVKLDPGLNLSIELVTIFSILLIVVFVLFLNKIVDVEKLSISPGQKNQ